MSLGKLDKQQLLSLLSLEFISFEIVMSIKKVINVWVIENINFYGKIIEPETEEHKHKCIVFNAFFHFQVHILLGYIVRMIYVFNFTMISHLGAFESYAHCIHCNLGN